MTEEERADAARSLRTVLADIDSGLLIATGQQRAYIAGALDALEQT